MTCEEITKITKICLTADSWCDCCSSNLCAQLREAFPEYIGVIDGIEQHKNNYHVMYAKALEARDFDESELKVWEICL